MSDLRETIASWLYGPDYVADWPIIDDEVKSEYYEAANSLFHLLREHGLVELDENQSLPVNQHIMNQYGEGQQDMLKAGFRKVKEIA